MDTDAEDLNQAEPARSATERNNHSRTVFFLLKKRETPSNVLLHIKNSLYKQIYLGNIELKPAHTNIRVKGQLTDAEKPLFDHVNTILQYPSCVEATTYKLSAGTLLGYSYCIVRYVEFMARQDIQVEDFVVDGNHMYECMKEWLELKDTSNDIGMLDATSSLIKFTAALKLLHEMMVLYEHRDCEDESKFDEAMQKWIKVPNIYKMDNYMMQRRMLRRAIPQEAFPNKGRLVQSTYTLDLVKRMMIHRLEQTGKGSRTDIHDGVNARLEFLLGHHYLFRSKEKRAVCLSDVLWEEEDTDRGMMRVLGFQFPESNLPLSSVSKAGSLRHKYVELCFISAFALSLWYRFDFSEQYAPLHGENMPNFLEKENWYPLKVLFTCKGPSPGRVPISYNYNCKLSSDTVASVGFTTVEKTRLGRTVNSQRADAGAVEDVQIKRAGKWSKEAVHNSDGTGYPYEFLHFSAGFKKDEPYYIDRDVDVPESLQAKVFPWLEAEITKVKNRVWPRGTHSINKDDTILPFLEMLKDFRKLSIQDLAVLVEISPNSMFAKHQITKDPLFIRFHDAMRTVMVAGQDILRKKLIESVSETAPIFAHKISMLTRDMDLLRVDHQKSRHGLLTQMHGIDLKLEAFQNRIVNSLVDATTRGNELLMEVVNRKIIALETWLHTMLDRQDSQQQELNDIKSLVNTIKSQLDTVILLLSERDEETSKRKKAKRSLQMAHDTFPQLRARQSPTTSATVSQQPTIPTSVTQQLAPSVLEVRSEARKGSRDAASKSDDTSNSSDAESELSRPDELLVEVTETTVPMYDKIKSLSQRITTVPELIQEWYVGLPGFLSVVEREDRFLNEWRSKGPVVSLYKRRKALIRFMEREKVENPRYRGFSLDRFGALVESYRQSTRTRLSSLCVKCQNDAKRRVVQQELEEFCNASNFIA